MAAETDETPKATTGEQDSDGFDMYGISGVTRYGAISRIYEEFLKELQGPNGMKSFREMADNCAIVGAILFAAQHLCRKVTFKFRPKDDSNEARKVADFVGGAIFDDMESTWPDTLSEILTMLTFGWSLLEFRMKRRMGLGSQSMSVPEIGTDQSENAQGYKVNPFAPSRFEDGFIGFRSWSLRSQETLFQWEFDEDSNAVVMQQMAPPDYRVRRVPLSKCLLFRTQVSKNNPEGRSILRNAWVSYYMKKNIQIFEGIGIERDMAGYPLIQIAPSDIAKNQIAPDIYNRKNPEMVALLSQMQKIVRSVRRDEQEGMVMPWWAEFKLVSAGSRRAFNTNDIIGRYDQRIAMSMMADFIMLGHEAVGSKALAATKISLFTSSLSSFLDTACTIIDRKAVSQLLRFNGIPQALAPVMEHGDVESVNMQELGEFISKVAGTGFNPLVGIDARKAVMAAAKLPTAGMDEGPLVMPGSETAGGEGEVDEEGNDKKSKPKPKGNKPNKPGDNKTGDDNADHPPVDAEGTNVGSPNALQTT